MQNYQHTKLLMIDTECRMQNAEWKEIEAESRKLNGVRKQAHNSSWIIRRLMVLPAEHP